MIKRPIIVEPCAISTRTFCEVRRRAKAEKHKLQSWKQSTFASLLKMNYIQSMKKLYRGYVLSHKFANQTDFMAQASKRWVGGGQEQATGAARASGVGYKYFWFRLCFWFPGGTDCPEAGPCLLFNAWSFTWLAPNNKSHKNVVPFVYLFLH